MVCRVRAHNVQMYHVELKSRCFVDLVIFMRILWGFLLYQTPNGPCMHKRPIAHKDAEGHLSLGDPIAMKRRGVR